jgi:hypothetical protein
MAESTLSISLTELQEAAGFFLGYGPSSDWSPTEAAELLLYAQAAVRQVYYPPEGEGIEAGYEWSWLKSSTTITTRGAYSTGTLTVAAGVVTLVGGMFPNWAADGTLTIDGTSYEVDTRDSDTQVTLVDTSLTVGAASTYSLTHPPYQDLPDDHGRIVGELTFEPEVYAQPIVVVSLAQLARLRSGNSNTGTPVYAAEREKASDGTTGQRKEILWWPWPDKDYVLNYQYEAYQGKLTEENPYPLGGMKYAELYTESILAIAEQRAKDERGMHTDSFMRLLGAMIAQDRRNGARHFGSLRGPDQSAVPNDPRRQRSSYQITYGGETW